LKFADIFFEKLKAEKREKRIFCCPD